MVLVCVESTFELLRKFQYISRLKEFCQYCSVSTLKTNRSEMDLQVFVHFHIHFSIVNSQEKLELVSMMEVYYKVSKFVKD